MNASISDIRKHAYDFIKFQQILLERLRQRDLLKFDCVNAMASSVRSRIFCMTRIRDTPRLRNNFNEPAVWLYSHRTEPEKLWVIFNEYQNKSILEYCLVEQDDSMERSSKQWLSSDKEIYLELYAPKLFDFSNIEKIVDLIENYLG